MFYRFREITFHYKIINNYVKQDIILMTCYLVYEFTGDLHEFYGPLTVLLMTQGIWKKTHNIVSVNLVTKVEARTKHTTTKRITRKYHIQKLFGKSKTNASQTNSCVSCNQFVDRRDGISIVFTKEKCI